MVPKVVQCVSLTHMRDIHIKISLNYKLTPILQKLLWQINMHQFEFVTSMSDPHANKQKLKLPISMYVHFADHYTAPVT